MSITIWTNANQHVKLHQLSDDPADGTAEEQIAYLATLSLYEGYTCVNQDYTGNVPNDDVSSWRWADGNIVAAKFVPASVTPRQVRLLLLQQGLLSQVEQMIAAQDEATKITWEFALEFKRDDPLLNALGANLGLTSEQIDDFFIAASNL